MAQSAIRDYLRSKGLSDGDITYNNGSVMAKGQRFMDATPQADGRTYADTGSLDNAYNAYDMRGQLAQMRTQATQVNPEVAAMRQALKDRISKPVQQFQYDQNNDPAYKSALESIRQNTQTDMNNARVESGAVGMRGGSLQNNQLMQVSAKNQSRLQNEITPQLMQQAYQRYIGQQNLENQQTGNMMQYADSLDRSGQQQFRNQADLLGQQNTLNQQDIVNSRNDQQDSRQKRLDNTAVQQWYQQQYGVPVEAKDDWNLVAEQVKGLTPIAMQEYQQRKAVQEAGLTGQFNGQETMDAKKMAADMADREAQRSIQQGQLEIQQQNANTSAARLNKSASGGTQPKQTSVNTMINTFNKLYTVRNKDTGKVEVTNKDALENAILGANMPDEQTMQLYNYYGIPIPQ